MRNFWASVIVFFVIVFCFWFQFNILNLVPLFGVTANIGIIFVVALGILCGKTTGITLGFIYGILSDILLGKSIGIYVILYLIVGYFSGKISYSFSKENKSSIVMMAAAATLIFEVICYFMFVIIYGYEFEFFGMLWTVILECIYNIFVAWVFFKPLSFLAEIINRGKRSYYLL